jgi:hypothetical protein
MAVFEQKDVFWDLKNLKRLDLSFNRIEEVSDELFVNMEDIQLISLFGNRIKHFPSNLVIENVHLLFFYTEGNPGDESNIDIRKIPRVKFVMKLDDVRNF